MSIFKMSAIVVTALSLSFVPAFAECTKTKTKTSTQSYSSGSQASGFQTVAWGGQKMGSSSANQKGDIIDVAVAAGSFKTLAAALTAAGLVDTLKGAGPFTVFAPTDAAFAKLPEGVVANLLKPENRAQLVSILTYHVVPGNVKAAGLLNKTTRANTVQGAVATIVGTSDSVTVNGVKVVSADVAASNGTIHVIDTVLMPPAPANAS
jgi:uncharacterized surface protein with fasciclin (FAS1) repeats